MISSMQNYCLSIISFSVDDMKDTESDSMIHKDTKHMKKRDRGSVDDKLNNLRHQITAHINETGNSDYNLLLGVIEEN
jgi:hypothetical protein